MTTVLGAYGSSMGESGEGLAAISHSLGISGGLFLYSKREQQKDLAKKTEAITHAAERR